MNKMMRQMKRMNWNKMIPANLSKRRNNRTKIWMSLLGVGLASGVTYVGMRNGRSQKVNSFMQNMMKNIRIPSTN
ncbi:hypothetical protein [Bacillus kwashiorkori]|uniref:hypothetical protein n=1 Tax=Bacillus kwashiorkori TaxID=1522318 RepID=UPI0007832E27|nr:hypothetical protein [Bacillus kwashiorkori]